MLLEMDLENLTVFQEAHFEFCKGLNVIVGANGAGKTHVLKIAYAVTAACAWGKKESSLPAPTKNYLQTAIAQKLLGVFKPDALGRLVRRQTGRNRCEIKVRLNSKVLKFSFNTASKSEVGIEAHPTSWLEQLPVYLPTRELMTVYPGFVSLYRTTELAFEETWKDTCELLGAPPLKGPRLAEIKKMLEPIEELMGGNVVVDGDRFYLKTPSGNIEAHLVAEGLRKLAMIARLIATGSLIGSGYLFWDEPEANLNPKLIRSIAKTILHLCKSGIQVFVATHSLFLLREIDILSRSEFPSVELKFFGLHPTENGVEVSKGSVDDIGAIDALQEELIQSDRYLATEGE